MYNMKFVNIAGENENQTIIVDTDNGITEIITRDMHVVQDIYEVVILYYA